MSSFQKIKNCFIDTFHWIARWWREFKNPILEDIRELQDPNKNLRNNTARHLAYNARMGWNIDPAIPTLIKTLDDPHCEVSRNAAVALATIAKQKGKRKMIVEKMVDVIGNHKHKTNMLRAIFVLELITRHGLKVTEALPILMEKMTDVDELVRLQTAVVFAYLAKGGNDIGNIIPFLANGVEDTDDTVREFCIDALVFAVNNEKTRELAIRVLVEKLRRPDDVIKQEISEAFHKIADARNDYREAVSALIDRLTDPSEKIRQNVIFALEVAGWKRFDIDILQLRSVLTNFVNQQKGKLKMHAMKVAINYYYTILSAIQKGRELGGSVPLRGRFSELRPKPPANPKGKTFRTRRVICV